MMKEVSWDDWEELATNIKRHGNSMAATGWFTINYWPLSIC
jgi:hypothetical protein